MKVVLFPVLMMILVYCFAACGSSSDKKDDETKKADYEYDEASLACVKNGDTGLNRGKVSECGYVKGKDFAGKDFSGMNLRGMTFEDCDLSGANFSEADLMNAGFVDSDLTGANFTNAKVAAVFEDADLEKATLHGAHFIDVMASQKRLVANIDYYSSFKDAEIDSRTVMNMTLAEAMRKGMKYKGADEGVKPEITKIGEFSVSFKVASETVVGRRDSDALSDEHFVRLKDDLENFANLKLKKGDSWYEKIFGGESSEALVKFVDERISYFIDRTDSYHDTVTENTMASNFGPSYWSTVYNDRRDQFGGDERGVFSITVDGEKVTYDKPRAGVVSIGPGYVDLEDGMLRRNGTLVHEARHSDCPEDPSNSELQRYLDDEEAPEGSRCNYPHAECPDGPLEGERACDVVPWGSYAVGAIFYEKVARDCENCSELDKQFALLNEKDAKSRVLVLEKMMDGKLGDPDMTSK